MAKVTKFDYLLTKYILFLVISSLLFAQKVIQKLSDANQPLLVTCHSLQQPAGLPLVGPASII